MSIWTGIDDLIDEWLRIEPIGSRPFYRHRSTAKTLSLRPGPIGGTLEFLQTCEARIDENWRNSPSAGTRRPSQENWRWKRHTELSESNTSSELRLERAIVVACGDDWSNQMPVASGLVDGVKDKRAAIDLVHRVTTTSFELIELKVASNNPLYAAMEILQYGLLLAWSQANQALNTGLEEFGADRNLTFKFDFHQLEAGISADMSTEQIRWAIDNRTPIWVP